MSVERLLHCDHPDPATCRICEPTIDDARTDEIGRVMDLTLRRNASRDPGEKARLLAEISAAKSDAVARMRVARIDHLKGATNMYRTDGHPGTAMSRIDDARQRARTDGASAWRHQRPALDDGDDDAPAADARAERPERGHLDGLTGLARVEAAQRRAREDSANAWRHRPNPNEEVRAPRERE